MQIDLPVDNIYFRDALLVLDALAAKGHEAWIVGGFIRDAVLGRESNDIDIATSANWQSVEDTCLGCGLKVKRSGIRHGTVTVLVPLPGEEPENAVQQDLDLHADTSHDTPEFAAFEVTTFRVDSRTSSDNRHPDSVEFTDSIVEDLARRDFTMNALAWSPESGLLDPFGGLKDLENGIIRVVGDASHRFKEDALRILRGCRFLSQLGFEIEPETLREMTVNKSLLLRISSERTTAELTLLLMGDHVHDAIVECADILSICVPELVAMKGFEQRTKYHVYDVLEHTAWAVQNSKNTPLVRWAALCHDMGKPSCAFFDANGVQHFYGHAIASERIAHGLMKRLSFSRAFRKKVCALVGAHNNVIDPTRESVKKILKRLDGNVELVENLFELKMADMSAHAPEYVHQTETIEKAREVLADVLGASEAFSLDMLAVNGNDLAALGMKQGPGIGEMLRFLLDETIAGNVENTRESLLDLAKATADDF